MIIDRTPPLGGAAWRENQSESI